MQPPLMTAPGGARRTERGAGRGWLCALVLSLVLLSACGDASPTPTVAPTVASPAAPTAGAPTAAVEAGAPVGMATRVATRDATASRTTTRTPGARSSATAARGTPQPSTDAGVVFDVRGDDDDDTLEGNRRNEVILENRTDGRLLARGSVQLNRIDGAVVEPVNVAYAYSSCTDCQTIAVALQINLVGREARQVAPQNGAFAINERCTRCNTVARALQYVYTVDDPEEVPDEVSALLREMEGELRAISSTPGITLPQAEARINAILAKFGALQDTLNDRREENDDDDDRRGTPTRGASPTVTRPPTTTTTVVPTPAPTPSATSPTSTPRTPTATVAPTSTPRTTTPSVTPTGAPPTTTMPRPQPTPVTTRTTGP